MRSPPRIPQDELNQVITQAVEQYMREVNRIQRVRLRAAAIDTYQAEGLPVPATASNALVRGVLPQRSRATRAAIVHVIRQRLVQWHPPDWVLADLVAFALVSDNDDVILNCSASPPDRHAAPAM
jgi:hypothetical protein